MNIKNKMIKVVKETADWYAEDPDNRRSIDADGQCMYTWGDSHCAVGRYLKEEYQEENWDNNSDSVNELCERSDEGYNIDWALRDEVQGLDSDFWTSLQDMHDTTSYWEEWNRDEDGLREYGLTDRGKEAYVELQDKIAEGRYDG